MSTPSQETSSEAMSSMPVGQRKPHRQRTIHSCNFRSAGRLSNEDARTLTTLHEGFVQHVSSALDAYLGTNCEVKLDGLDQLTINEHLSEIPAHCYVVPVSSNALFLEFDTELVFPIIELLLGGMGDTRDPARMLSEIEEEIMQDILLLLWNQLCVAWRMPGASLEADVRIKATELHQAFPMHEKATVFRFSAKLGGAVGAFRIVMTTDFMNTLLKQIRQVQPQRRSSVWTFPMPPLRERILDCDVEVTAELPSLRVSVRDLIALQPGSVLKLHAPIRNPGMLTAGGHGLFEAAPVRIGSQRAAQLGRWVRSTDRERR